jgi:tetratricopeptide (TPR) repeat protein
MSIPEIESFMSLIAPARRTALLVMAAMLACAPHVRGQDVASVIQLAERDRATMNPVAALGRYDAALVTTPTSYELLWRAARESIDLGEAATDPSQRTAHYAKAEAYARRAVAANASAADGHFMLAVALGRTALSLGSRDRVRYAGEIRTEALTALRDDPRHAGAAHVLGVWNAEVMRLGSFSRFAARNFLGGKVFDQASWAEAVRYMELAVAADPGRITHRLDLAKVYADTNDKPKARGACEAAMKMPVTEFNDARYKRECEGLLAKLR